jgi:tetratricopeptide (TPR) repeat protein
VVVLLAVLLAILVASSHNLGAAKADSQEWLSYKNLQEFDTFFSLCSKWAMLPDREAEARQRFQEAFAAQMEGDYDRAVELYLGSLALHPTAEAYTFLGWTYHFQGKIEEAIAECKRAIEIDPDFGNPYNDIGAYLIDLNRFDEAIPWLEQAMMAKRYEPRHFPYFNLGRVYLAKGMINRARELFQKSLALEPRYSLARHALESVRRMVN